MKLNWVFAFHFIDSSQYQRECLNNNNLNNWMKYGINKNYTPYIHALFRPRRREMTFLPTVLKILQAHV